MMRSIVFSLFASALLAAPANAAMQSCTRAGDVRTIEVLTPGVVGAACDLRYVRENGNNISVPYHADYSAAFCVERAAALVASLVAAGYTCSESTTVAPLRDAAADAPLSDQATVAAAVEQARQASVEHSAPTELAGGDFVDEAPAAQLAYPDAPIVAETPPETSEPVVLEQPALAQNVVDAPADLAEPSDDSDAPGSEPALASRGPTALSTTLASAPATAPAPRSSVVGRLVGAAPDATPIAQAAVATSEERLAPAPVAAPVEQQKIASVSPTPSGGRPAADIIKGVLTAQAAAWNEGDLEAFMGGYWKSSDVRFVSGTTVTKGWQQTLNRYRDRYGRGASLGRLSFDSLDVQMVTDDVAVVVGRFNLASGGSTETGAFTLVMKRFDGLWRIVHDHSVGDQAPTATQ